MIKPEHLVILEKGVDVWNGWRQENPEVTPDLEGAALQGRTLGEVNLSCTKLQHALLTNADLTGADLSGADLRGADLSGANLSRSNLSKSTIDTATRYTALKGCSIGVNGFYSPETDSAALMRIDPPGNSMQGSNVEAVIESLKHARKLHTFSLVLAGIALLFIVIKPTSITLPYLSGSFKFDALTYAFLATVLSSGLLSLVAIFIDSALQGARYLNDRSAAMTVGHFPWLLSKYEHDPPLERQSRIMRLFLCFHPVLYLYFFVRWSALFIGDWEGFILYYQELPFFLAELLLPLLYFQLIRSCFRIFRLSEGFQKPILFDTVTERERRSDMEHLIAAVEKQASRTTELVELMRKREG
ncbi:pentapeptide repeat-containing protein [Chlorobium sp. BLA1]|uniref:pentapeptide repeat-containing protein n=1 Tax=Candidatus Chlorobium masyuteum TaxID=2716876 RepID=UPI00142289A8|nr:pentapeptide repeat-containing protein [Candidatus Chlorobium masyuteum]NHQ60671.1 pentapeptide repeat-containing protein [Candidatus Chlorobium masyuteum]